MKRKGKPGTAPTGKSGQPFSRVTDCTTASATIAQSAPNGGSTARQWSGRKPTAGQLRPPAQDAGNPQPA